MKKFLVVLLALAMILAIATTAMAADTKIPDYNDTKTSTEYAIDIYRLTALGVLEGNTGWGGAYRPADNLTRAEFAKIACFMFGKQDYKEYYAAQKSAFSDVPEGHWAEGWINCANDNGLMIGVGGGKFAPEANVSKQEVATVTLRGVGYDDNLPGDWPADYIKKSQEVHSWFDQDYKEDESLFEYVQKIDGTAATRAEMAAIVNYCLDLYRVEYVGDQTQIAGISNWMGVDSDGYAYVKRADTNEKPDAFWAGDILNSLLGNKTDLLWDVFGAYVIPEFEYDWWNGTSRFVEASGWGYEDFAEKELLFSGWAPVDYPDLFKFIQDIIAEYVYDGDVPNDIPGTYGALPVATDYYIFDQYLDGELWQLGARLAHLTVMDDEAVFAEMLSDVNYIGDEKKIDMVYAKDVKVDNADIYSYDGDNYAIYDYDLFKHVLFGIVHEVGENEIYLAVAEGDEEAFDAFNGTYDDDGMFCIKKGGCDSHDQKYVILKDGKLQDPSCLKVNDVVYEAGKLALNDKGEDEVWLYIAYTPVKATFDELVNGKAQVNISGEDYWYCSPAGEEDDDNKETDLTGQALVLAADDGDGTTEPTEEEAPIYHWVSYDNGYEDGVYGAMYYDELYAKITEDGFDGACLFAPAYGKLYVATLIFGADEDKTAYGVITNFDFNMKYPYKDDWFAKKVNFFGPDGKQTGLLTLTEDVNVGNEDAATGEVLYGTLANYFFDGEDEVITEKIGEVVKNDVGYIKLDPADEPLTVSVDERGFFAEPSADYDDLDAAADTADYGAQPKSFKDMKITADTIIFEVSTKVADETAETPEQIYKSVELGDPADYKTGKDFTCSQIGIFSWSGSDIKVLYVVNPKFEGDVLFGLFDVSRVDNAGGFAKHLDTGVRVDFDANAGKDKLKDADLVYAGCLPEDGVADTVIIGADSLSAAKPDIAAGEFVALIDAYGFALDAKQDAKDVILNYVEGATAVSDEMAFGDVAKKQLTDETEYYDLVGKKGFEAGYFDGKIHDDDSKYEFITVTDKYGKIIEIFRVNKGDKPAETTPGEGTTYDGEAGNAPAPAEGEESQGGLIEDNMANSGSSDGGSGSGSSESES